MQECADGTGGEMFTTKATYRKAVDDALFRLGSRYDPLIDLLIQLRQPQLMRDLNEESLSSALSDALAPVDPRLVAEVAESFQGLETDRQRTGEYRRMPDSVVAFQESYRRYLAVAVRRLCAEVRLGHSQYEHAGRGVVCARCRASDRLAHRAGRTILRTIMETGRFEVT